MDDSYIVLIAKLRFIIGYLGEKAQHGWWQSAFFAPTSRMFLTPVFNKTSLLAQYSGVVEAAQRIHDEHISVASAYHLFRLPRAMEQELYDVVKGNQVLAALVDELKSPSHAEGLLSKALEKVKKGVLEEDVSGPIRLGDLIRLSQIDGWLEAASYYQLAFSKGIRVFPYFSEVR